MSTGHAFLEALERAIDLASHLESLLFEETAVLEGRDPEQLQRLAERKREVVERLEHETQQLKAAVEQAGHEFSPAGLDGWLAGLPVLPEAPGSPAERWTCLREVAARCELMNRSNATTIERNRKRVATALRIIRGEDENAATYSAKGHSATAANLGRTLTRA